jgi:predicted ATPase/transcriptional regulator with XRE-family HTH domain
MAESFGHLLHRFRARARLNISELAEALGADRKSVAAWEAHQRVPRDRARLIDLAEVLRLSPSETEQLIIAVRHHRPSSYRDGLLAADSGPFDSPPPVAPPADPVTSQQYTPLPVPLTSFIGREQEVARLRAALLHDVRLLTIIGSPGVGKTHLALYVAAHLSDSFADGVYFVSLAPIADPELVVATIAAELGLGEDGSQQLVKQLTQYLQHKRLLLVLDNFEQVLAAGVGLAELLVACPQLKILVTSRASLQIRGEQQFPLLPLGLPPQETPESIERLLIYPAVTLFLDRAGAIKPGVTLTSENAAAICAICTDLDGLPLAIELMAARINLFPPQTMLDWLRQSRLHLLRGGTRDMPPRHRTLSDAIQWSYNLLDHQEQVVFARLSVFVNGCTFEAAAAVCSADRSGNLLDAVIALIDNSLVQQRLDGMGQPRLAMLETIREYAFACLLDLEAVETSRYQHLRYYLQLVEAAESQLSNQQQGVWQDRLDAEHGNLRAALQWALERREIEFALRFGGVLWRFWQVRGYLSEGRRWLTAILDLRSPADGDCRLMALRANALNGASMLARIQGDYDQAVRLLEESLSLWRQLGDKSGIAIALDALGFILHQQGQFEQAQQFCTESLTIFQELNDRVRMAHALNDLGFILHNQGQHEQAKVSFTESLAIGQAVGDHQGNVFALFGLGFVAYSQGDYPAAREHLQRSLLVQHQLGNKLLYVYAQCLEVLAGVAIKEGRPSQAAQGLGAAEVLREQLNVPLPPAYRPLYQQVVQALHAILGEPGFSEAWAAGRALTRDQVLAYALDALMIECAIGD